MLAKAISGKPNTLILKTRNYRWTQMDSDGHRPSLFVSVFIGVHLWFFSSEAIIVYEQSSPR